MIHHQSDFDSYWYFDIAYNVQNYNILNIFQNIFMIDFQHMRWDRVGAIL